MATFVTHGLVGAASLAVPVRLLGGKPWLVRTAAALGFVLGSAPDTFDWVAATIFNADRWVLYSQFHDGIYTTVCAIVYPCGLHLLADKPFHRIPGYDWWNDLWWLEIGLGLCGLALTWWAVRKRSRTAL
jgi:hypothetical protein